MARADRRAGAQPQAGSGLVKATLRADMASRMTASDDPIDASVALAGRLLIAMPGIDDPRFERAVILMVSHSEEEAMGVAVNNPVEGLPLSTLLERLGVNAQVAGDRAVLVGGPVDRERGFVVHTDDYATAVGTVPVSDGLSLTATREVLEHMGGAPDGPRRAVLALGCAGWSPGQLEQELRDNVWLVAEADEALIFDGEHETKWARALAKIGVAADRLSAAAGSA